MFCNPKAKVMKVTKIIELTPCHIEINLETDLLCGFPVFNTAMKTNNDESNIDCFPLLRDLENDKIKEIVIESKDESLPITQLVNYHSLRI